MNQKSSMNVGRESDGREVPAKSLNKDGRSSAEGSEGRRPAKENIEQTTTSQTQSWANVLSGLRGVREAARSDKRLQFTALLHHVSVALLESSFYALKRDAVDRVRALRSRQPKRAWRREAGDVQLPRIHPHLWANVEDRQVPRSTQDHP